MNLRLDFPKQNQENNLSGSKLLNFLLTGNTLHLGLMEAQRIYQYFKSPIINLVSKQPAKT